MVQQMPVVRLSGAWVIRVSFKQIELIIILLLK